MNAFVRQILASSSATHTTPSGDSSSHGVKLRLWLCTLELDLQLASGVHWACPSAAWTDLCNSVSCTVHCMFARQRLCSASTLPTTQPVARVHWKPLRPPGQRQKPPRPRRKHTGHTAALDHEARSIASRLTCHVFVVQTHRTHRGPRPRGASNRKPERPSKRGASIASTQAQDRCARPRGHHADMYSLETLLLFATP